MKKHLLTAVAIGTALLLSPTAFAQAKKKEPAKPAEPTPTEPAKPAPEAKPKSDPKADAKPAKPLPMTARADEIDAAARTFTHVNNDGKKLKHFVAAEVVVKQGDAVAKFEDIKQGDVVNGRRVKKNADGTEYEVVNITSFGPPKKKEEAKPAAKAAEKKSK